MNNKLENAFAVVVGFLAKHKNKTLAIVAGVLVPAAFVMAQAAGIVPSPSTIINCMVAGSCNNVVATPEPASQTFGANAYETTNWISGDFSDDVAIGDAVTVGGNLTVTGTSTFSGEVSGVAKALRTTMSSSATSTACSILNNSGSNRVVVAAGVVDRGTAASTGAVLWTIGTSTYAGVSSTTPWNTLVSVTRASGVDVYTTTSSLMTAYSPWRIGEYINFEANTSTNAGSCRVLYY